MSDRRIEEEAVYRFIYDHIDTVPHLEALLQLWRSRPRRWAEEELAQRLFITTDVLTKIMQDLAGLDLVITGVEDGRPWYAYQSKVRECDDLMESVDATYSRELLRITAAIHAKASSGAREFGRAFKFKKRPD